MWWVLLPLSVSIAAQLAAVLLAFRLSAVYGQRLAWNCISLALVIMLVRRGMTLYGASTGDWATGGDAEYSISWAAALSTLAASLVFLVGIALIGPVVKTYARVEDLLRGEIDRLDRLVRLDQVELRIAAEIQRDMLPAAPPALEGFDVAGKSYPATTVGADYFDFIPLTSDGMIIAVGDVSGHGVGPALLMAETRAYLRAVAEAPIDLGEMLTRANRFLCDHHDRGRFVTLFLAHLAADDGSMRYSSAGHPAYLLRTSGEVEVLAAKGIPLGMMHEATFDCGGERTMQPGEVLLVVTDGVPESREAHGKMFGTRRTLASVRAHSSRGAEAIIAGLFHEVLRFAGCEPQEDDMTLVVAKRTPQRILA